MNDTAIVLTPLLVLLILALFRFTGCKSFGAADPPPTTPPGSPPPPQTYEQMIAATPGFAAHWRLNETGGNVAKVLGPLSPAADGIYKSPGGGAAVSLGKPGVLSHKDSKDFAPEFDGTGGFVEVPFNAVLNPAPNVAFSVELWVKPNPDAPAGVNAQVVISSHKTDPANKRGYEIALVKKTGEPHQQIRARVFSTGAGPSEVIVQPNQGDRLDWRHIVLTYQGGGGGNTLTLYVRVAKVSGLFKGGPLAGALYENVLAGNPATLRFGADNQGANGSNFFAGRIDEVAFYNAALSETEIEKHFKAF
jgi:hypothetical protein